MLDSLPANAYVLRNDFRASGSAVVQHSRASRARDPDVGVNNEIVRISQSQHQPLHEFDGELARVSCLLNVVVFNIWNGPDVAGILP
jgi:hypothetical protein